MGHDLGHFAARAFLGPMHVFSLMPSDLIHLKPDQKKKKRVGQSDEKC